MSQKSFQKYFMIYFIVFGAIISFFGAGINYAFQIKEINFDTNKKAKDIYDIKIQTILKSTINNMDETVKSLATNKTVLEYITTNSFHAEEDLEQIFMAVVASQKEIMQARLISKDGKEIIRIDRNKNDDPFAISKDKLQDKSDSDYFQIVSKMNEQSIWHSKIDLNIENGKIEIPYNPVFRIAMPLFNNNEFSGMVIVNMHIDNLFNAIGKSSAFEHYIVDKDNNFILHPNNEFSFNKYKNIDRNLNIDFPNGLNIDEIFLFSIDNVLHNDDKATLILKTKNVYKSTLLDSKIYTSIWVVIITIILSFILSIFVSRNPVKLQIALLKAHEKLNEFTKIIDNYIIKATTKKDSTIINVSSAFVKSSGYSKEELIGEKMHIVRHPDEDENKFKELWQTVSSGKIWDGEIRNKNKKGEDYWLHQHIIPTFDENNNIETLVSLGTDITAKKELEKMASIDKLTNIYNRRMIDDFLKQEVEIEKRHSNGLSVILIDIDHFKDVNDTYGHQMGDIVLSKIAELITINSRKSDIQGRYGGEEFIIICPQTTCNQALILAEKIRVSIEDFTFEQIGKKTISLGISSFEENDAEEDLVKKADIALYEAKNTGRNKVIVYKEL
ncbi:MAG: GGDEF domain-containing protein [Arcobacter sp.]|uniref:sensor domain-containing diguanylate cyclase n=1 Tax=Arcobacter sp. TaxID=1872629 RepID=UPI003CFDDE7A